MNLRTRAWVSALLGFVALLLFYQTPLMRSARAATWNYVVRNVAAIGGVGQLAVENDAAEQMKRIVAENISLQSQVRDYNRLRAQLGSVTIDALQPIPAAVIGRPADTFRLRLGISRGLADGVTIGAPVVVRGRTLIGFIADADQATATVQLLLHPQTNLTVEVSPDDPDMPPGRGLLRGQHYTSLSVSTIPRDVRLTPGQAVVTVASETIPFGLFIGTIGQLYTPENEPYQSADIALPYDPDVIDAVTVLVTP